MRAYRASGSFQISSKGELFFLGLIEDLTDLADVEAGASVICPGVLILTVGKAFGDENSRVTLLTIACV